MSKGRNVLRPAAGDTPPPETRRALLEGSAVVSILLNASLVDRFEEENPPYPPCQGGFPSPP